MPHIDRSREVIGGHGSNERVKLCLVVKERYELVDFETGRIVQNLDQLRQVIVFQLHTVFLRSKSVQNIDQQTQSTTDKTCAFQRVIFVNCCRFNFKRQPIRLGFVVARANMIAQFVTKSQFF